MKDILNMNDNEINSYVDNMLIGVKAIGVKEMLHKRLLGIVGLYLKQKKELEELKEKIYWLEQDNADLKCIFFDLKKTGLEEVKALELACLELLKDTRSKTEEDKNSGLCKKVEFFRQKAELAIKQGDKPVCLICSE